MFPLRYAAIGVVLAALTCLVVCGADDNGPQAEGKTSIQIAMDKWNAWLSRSFAAGDDTAKIDKLMAGKFRDRAAYVYGGSGDYGLYYLIDDALQVKFEMNLAGKLRDTPTVMRKGTWLKGPDGYLVDMPDGAFQRAE